MRAPVKLIGGYTQILPSNWKLYVENTRDSYHASLLHMFFTTFRLNRLSQKGGLVVSESGGNHVSYSMRQDVAGKEYEQAGMRTAHDGYRLEAPELLENIDEFGDGIGLQILTVFPGFLLQQIRNSLAVRRIVPRGLDQTELVWTCFGFTSDDDAMTERRLRQANLDRPRRLHLARGRRRHRLRPARHPRRRRRGIRGRDGRQRHRVGREPGQRGGGARLLEGLPPPHGILIFIPLPLAGEGRGSGQAGDVMSIEQVYRLQEINARYVEAIDDDRLEAWPDFFADDGRYRITTAENVAQGLPLSLIYATSRAMLRDRVRALREANVYESQHYRHVLGRAADHRGRGHEPVARARPFMVARVMHTGDTMLFATGCYEDRVVIGATDAHFAEKTVILDSRQVDTLLAIPL